MISKRLAAIALIVTAYSAEASSAPPRMLLQSNAVADSGAASGSRTSFAIMRMPDGSFAFYDRNNSQGGPLTLPDHDGGTYTLLPALPNDITNSQAVTASDVLSNTQLILTPDRRLVSIFVQAERFDKETAAKVGLPLYLDVWIKQASLTNAVEPRMIWRGYNGSLMEYQQLPGGRILVPYGSFSRTRRPCLRPAGIRRSSNTLTTVDERGTKASQS